MTYPVDVRALNKSGARLEEIARAFGVERRDGELLRTWYRRIDMAIHKEEFEYKLLREVYLDVDYEFRREAERAGKTVTADGMVA
jgi:hypothetical protein